MANSATYRRHRPRRGQTRQEPSDAIVVALTAQVVVCIILLLLAVLVKKADEAKYSGVKQQYDVLVTDPTQSEDAIAYLNEGGLQGVFASIERAIQSLLSRLTGEEPPIRIVDEAPPDDDQEQNWEPAADQEPAPEADDPAAIQPTFDYDYLDTAELSLSSPLGQGGLNPVATGETTGLEAPPGNSLGPVALAGKIQPPVTGLITSEFAYRYHPVSGDSDFHNGMDIAAEEGRDVLAAFPGDVVEVGWSDIYGNYILLQHSGSLQTFYAHCSEIIAAEGMTLRQGARIAKVGQTGVATGPHLHFSVLVDEKYVDPYWVLKDNITLVD